MSDELKELKRLAEAATPGPWMYNAEDNIIYPQIGLGTIAICYRSTEVGKEQRNANAAYTAAANPTTILKLLAELEQAKADAARYRWLRSQKDDPDETPRIDVVLWTCEEDDEGIKDNVNEGEAIRMEALDAAIDEKLHSLWLDLANKQENE